MSRVSKKRSRTFVPYQPKGAPVPAQSLPIFGTGSNNTTNDAISDIQEKLNTIMMMQAEIMMKLNGDGGQQPLDISQYLNGFKTSRSQSSPPETDDLEPSAEEQDLLASPSTRKRAALAEQSVEIAKASEAPDSALTLLLPPPQRSFADFQELKLYLKSYAKTQGYNIVITSTTLQVNATYKYFGCDRGGHYRPPKNADPSSIKGVNSKKIGCPFSLEAKYLNKTNEWTFDVSTPYHNHEAEPNAIARADPSQFSLEEIELMEKLRKGEYLLPTGKNYEIITQEGYERA